MFRSIECLRGKIQGSFLILENQNKILLDKESLESFNDKDVRYYLLVQSHIIGVFLILVLCFFQLRITPRQKLEQKLSFRKVVLSFLIYLRNEIALWIRETILKSVFHTLRLLRDLESEKLRRDSRSSKFSEHSTKGFSKKFLLSDFEVKGEIRLSNRRIQKEKFCGRVGEGGIW